eukprot:CAMPEP_0115081830 /NCGR_PEP_ID=MMETSP0227-20121206/19520_1 /TAXON_ID=89957 /ORGANISM="Polarella glacialis, Strain CCMP 1383" /LENGTH=782 /DNA_ID=CAMNT_0002469765 /DNA_START=100 /DNA_END=2448 /DNA_ORIENTATION=+
MTTAFSVADVRTAPARSQPTEPVTSRRGRPGLLPPGSSGCSFGSVTTATHPLLASAVAAIGRSAHRHRGRARRQHRLQLRQGNLQFQVGGPGRKETGYCEATEKCVRRKTRTVTIGAIKIGSDHPIATQTMANTLTHDVEATVAQIKRCADAGIDMVRVTVQGMREAKACEHIKRRLLEDGYTTPVIADIHFTPKVAMMVADHVDKVRVNPGNFVDGRKSFDTITELTEEDVQEAKAQIEQELAPLVLKLKEKNKALRIGVNHGSMSERILFQHGDTPQGMVASALEFGEICRKHDFHNFCFSMKSSNPQVMVKAYRLLAREMYLLGWDYPLHLGVTEAGGGSDGRIKSAVGIGALLLDGLGDTVRVSLTEDPEREVMSCIALRRAAEAAVGQGLAAPFEEPSGRREGHSAAKKCDFPLDVPLNSDGSVLASITAEHLRDVDSAGQLYQDLGIHRRADGEFQKDWTCVDALVVEGDICKLVAAKIKDLLNLPIGVICRPGPNVPEGATLLYSASEISEPMLQRLGGRAIVFTGEESPEEMAAAIKFAAPRFLLLRPETQKGVTFLSRRFFATLSAIDEGRSLPTMLWFRYQSSNKDNEDDAVIRASADFGSLFVDGLGEGLLWDSDALTAEELREASFNLLQAARKRISKTEFISCPSCGRTLFDLEKTTKAIQQRTGHLAGVRIAVMGCIVNGPGEMADADFGYVGSGVGKVDLYVGYDCVRRAIPSGGAVDALTELIREHGRWQDPPSSEDDSAWQDPEVQGAAVVDIKVLGRQLIVEAF